MLRHAAEPSKQAPALNLEPPGQGPQTAEEDGKDADQVDPTGAVVPKEVMDAAKDGSSVTQSTMVNQINMAPNIADGDVLKAAETQRDDAMPVIPSSGRSPEASIQSPDGAAALQSQSEAQLQDPAAQLSPGNPDPTTT